MIKRVFPVIALAVFSAMLGGAILAPLLPKYVATMGASGIGIGAIFASYSVAKVLVMPLVGKYSDRLGRKRFMATGLFAFSVLSLAYIWAGTIEQLILIRVIHGFAGGMILPVARASIGDLTPVGQESRWMGYFNFTFFAGMGGGPLLGGVLYDLFAGSTNAFFGGTDSGIVAAFGTMGLLSLLAFLGVIFFLPSFEDKKWARRRQTSFREMSRSNYFRGLFSQRLLENMARRCTFAFLPIFGGFVLGLSATQIGLLMTVNTVLSAVLQPFSGHLVDRLNKKTVLVVGSLAAAAYVSLMPSVSSYGLLMLIMVANALRTSMSSPAASGMMVEEGRRYGMATTMATFSLAIAIGETLGPVLGGALVDLFAGDSRAAFYLGALVYLAGALTFKFFMDRSDRDGAAVVLTAEEGNGDPMATLEKEDGQDRF
jgi:MFS family permease